MPTFARTASSLLLVLAGAFAIAASVPELGNRVSGSAPSVASPSATARLQAAPTLSIESKEALAGDPVRVPVQASGFGDIGSISLTITYDPSVLSFPTGAQTEDLIAGAPREDFMANVTEPGTLKVSWFDATDPLRIGDETLLELTFSEYKGGSTPVGFEDESEVTDPQAQSYEAQLEGGTVQSAAEKIDTSVRRQFGPATSPSDYELVALPGRAGVGVAETLSGQSGRNWRAFREAGGENGEGQLLEYDGSEAFVFKAGRGFWVIAQGDWAFEGTVPAVPTTGNPSIPLQSGWNAVSNPFQQDLRWSSVRLSSGLQEALWEWTDDGWQQASVMESATTGKAYYVFNGAGLDSLDFPASALGAAEGDRQHASPGPLVASRSSPAAPLPTHMSSSYLPLPSYLAVPDAASPPAPRPLPARHPDISS